MNRVIGFVYGVLVYVSFLGVFLYAVGFLADRWVPRTINDAIEAPLTEALLVDALLLGLFAVQHSVMSRPGFKRAWTRLVPDPVERSTYVLATNLVLVLLFWQWREIPNTVWRLEGAAATAVWVLFGAGWALVLWSTFVIDHFDLFGLRQVWFLLRGHAYERVPFQVRFPYDRLRHPLMLGWLVVFWSAPHMTGGRLLFAGLASAYIFVGIRLEEHDLAAVHGEDYERYRRSVSMVLPFGARKGG